MRAKHTTEILMLTRKEINNFFIQNKNQNQKKTRDDLRNKTKKHVLKILINKQINKQNF